MRLKANKMGYSLNQKGLYHNVIRNPRNRTEKLENGTFSSATYWMIIHTKYIGQILASETEREIFDILGACVPENSLARSLMVLQVFRGRNHTSAFDLRCTRIYEVTVYRVSSCGLCINNV